MVVWIIGLSGVGKTTLARNIYLKLAEEKKIVWLDGDMIRKIFGNDLGHTIDDRCKNSDRISKLSKFLDDQNINVICSILSNFEEHRVWNRKFIKNYYEVYIKCPMSVLIKRDEKGLYKDFKRGKIKNVIGVDIEFNPPRNPNLIIENNSDLNHLLSYSKKISSLFK